MKLLLTTYPNDGRKLKQFLTALLKKKLIFSAKVINYAKSYTLVAGKIQKEERKLMLLSFPKVKEEALLAFISQLHPNQHPELTILRPEYVDEAYLKELYEVTQ